MTKREAEYLNRLHDRRRMLESRLAYSELRDTSEIRKELNALKWAIAVVQHWLEQTK